jgi:hypothetical protein
MADWAISGGTATGNIDTDPLLADSARGDYHLQSQAGRWDPNSESWVIDDVTSPCIDAGDPNSPVGEEPHPDGGRINMGAYGGTASQQVCAAGSPIGSQLTPGFGAITMKRSIGQ